MKRKIVKFIPTQKKLAEKLGISQMSISRVINNRPGVGLKLKQKVLEVMKKSNYIHNRIASGLVSKATKIIGLIVPDITSSFFPEIAKSVEEKARENEYRIILAQSYESYLRECEEINLLLGFYVEGVIIAPAGNQNEIEIYQRLKDLKIPFVFIDRVKEKIKCSSIVTDTKKGAYLLGKYLIRKKYKKWGYLRGPKGIYTSKEHFAGLKKSLQESDKSRNVITSIHAGFFEKDGYRATKRLLAKVKPDVIIGVNDPVAIGAYRFLKENGIKISQDIALAGFSDIKTASIIEPSLTTVKEFPSKIGKKAVEILIEEIQNPEQKKQAIKIEPVFVMRESA